MNRRSFVKKLGLLCLAPFVPKVFFESSEASGGIIPMDATTDAAMFWGTPGESVVSSSAFEELEEVYFDGDPIFFDNRRVLTDGVRLIVK